ncbi:protein of unknown function [Taphrina deformans PYCC 5710]|uniref:DUF1772-domain-containing protein n=1 Tax=Taphrina deformans (strain PYCC 5710 / ATCC 11124 / CBS 356.35 / IMI 108563 / JCM 9778 / NBRC 8474) TaxID=1097556 RepID=R4XK09_TAPDE|nr:protein of unknown function [Taphrina deformans PYCC 5710]|eukprot:CCG83648.1 protein of unknown function [Taphrina deformans PYCC 5710]
MYRELVSIGLVGTTTCALYLSATAGYLLNGYKSTSEKLAKVSSTAQKDLEDTQKTVGIALLSSIFSLSSLAYIQYRPKWTVYVSLFNTLLEVLAYRMILGYWKDNEPTKTMKKLPGMVDYTTAWSKMHMLEKVIVVSGGGWCLMTMMASPNEVFK